ncbi:MAG: sigma-70 family RNA polymerase sigma factor [Planctomycetaceae bacterium]|nr:sigma-70 family RNA polymerase sigma factor [Planctomycetaceae bacterium]
MSMRQPKHLHVQADDEDFQTLWTRARQGSETALTSLVEQSQSVVFRAIRRRLLRELRTQLDSEDVAQSVWLSLLVRCKRSFQTKSVFLRFAVRLASNKTIDKGRNLLCPRTLTVNNDHQAIDEQLSHYPTPETLLGLNETLEEIEATLPTEFQPVVRLRHEGASIQEVVKELNIPRRSLFRALQRAREHIAG